jgi:hypothetical protein
VGRDMRQAKVAGGFNEVGFCCCGTHGAILGIRGLRQKMYREGIDKLTFETRVI